MATTAPKFTSLAQVEAFIGSSLEKTGRGFYNVPNWPTVTMDRKQLLQWANQTLRAMQSRIQLMRSAYRQAAATRAQLQAKSLSRFLFA